ncbi:A24 family peptidase [Microbacterium chocolatum]|uniref:A24 family peptidase n=1 Tax=Microbacterium aurantiacum TaxID=162393 RepID=UPI00338D535F
MLPEILRAGILLAFLGWGAVLAVIDVRSHRLPNRIVLPAYPVAIAALGLLAAASGDAGSFIRALVGGVILFGAYALLRSVRGSGLGGGDVKLAGVLGLLLGFAGWGSLLVGAAAAFVSGGLYAVALLALRRADRRTAIPFGPWMLLGAWIGLLVPSLTGNPPL